MTNAYFNKLEDYKDIESIQYLSLIHISSGKPDRCPLKNPDLPDHP